VTDFCSDCPVGLACMTAVVNDVKKARTGNVIASFCLDSRNASIAHFACPDDVFC